MTIIDIATYRANTGHDSNLISDADVQTILDTAERNITNHFKVYATPRLVNEIINGDGKRTIELKFPYALQIRKLQYSDREQDLKAWFIRDMDNIIELKRNAYIQGYPFYGKVALNIRCKYLSWFYDRTNTVKETTGAITDGDNIQITLDDVTDLEVDDYVLIEGLDRNKEGAKITAINGNVITVDRLVQDHEAESLVTKLEVRRSLYEYILWESAIYGARYAVGSTYTFNTSYTIEGVSTTVGIPYPHFEKQSNDFNKARDAAKIKFMNDLLVVV